eukprot:CAMPEP_0204843410 /NCGR_PEP_ID=MMETSP1346-20131115/47962_1 /ASSEMBLY_ACC=CAM_ASM_000771 /TAXON_ID=215587 /ORGANISM="Aplanochytrium stocchinoi, Strain GSBS06" /LENGTH=221 /DNA_ID=CAMNT_0051982549 /DNA_START=77 /DNA_END=739 /DNA_ORIENTATION=-
MGGTCIIKLYGPVYELLLVVFFSFSMINGAEIKVIGAGMGRTGTVSLVSALEILGYKPYHYVEPSHAKRWAQFAEGMVSSDDIIDMIINEGFNATFDNPAADIFAEQFVRFPTAKVILTVRDNSKAWEESFVSLLKTISVTEADFSLLFPSFLQWIPLMKHLKRMRCLMGTHIGLKPCELMHHWQDKPEGWLARQYEVHNEKVAATVPQEQLLIFNVKEGW